MADKRSKSSAVGPPPAVAQAVATIEAVNVYPDVVQGVPYQPPGGAYQPPGGAYQPPGVAYQPPAIAYQPPIPPNHYGSSQNGAMRASHTAAFDEGACRRYLFEHGWPLGLQSALIGSLQKVPIRYVICDDSGSMMTTDGNKVVGTGNASRFVSCSRWAELTEALRFQVGLAWAARLPTEFRLLNGLGPVTVGAAPAGDAAAMAAEGHEASRLMQAFDACPDGGTPLCRHIQEVIAKVTPMAAQLRANGQKVALIIATDGEPSDGNIIEAMRPLHNLPVWVVLRMCTDDDRIGNFWSAIDRQLELHMDVIDDFVGEAREAYRVNRWLTYGEPLQRLREFGVTMKEIDMLDEAPLTPDQLRSFCAMLFNVHASQLPSPLETSWPAFAAAVKQLCDRETPVWNPATRRVQPWVDTQVLASGKWVQAGPQGQRQGKGKEDCAVM